MLKMIKVNVKSVVMVLQLTLMNVSLNVEIVGSTQQKNEKMVMKLVVMDVLQNVK